MERKRIGIVSPYGWDTPGGVQAHIADLAEYLIAQGHEVSVLAPVSSDAPLQNYVVNAGKPTSIPYNGAVAQILFGPIAYMRVRQWINQGNFDLLHLHEPAIPSLSFLACIAADGPLVGTFHVSSKKQKAIYAIGPIIEPVIEKLTARIAVSEAARLTLTDHLATDAVIIPNGIYAERLTHGVVRPEWSHHSIGFMGRFEEPRKGLQLIVEALPRIIEKIPDVRVLVAGPGNHARFLESVPQALHSRFAFLGRISESEKADFLKSVSVFCAPNTGGESFGIILAEAMAAGAAIVGSDIPAFDAVLQQGKAGALFISEDVHDLSRALTEVIGSQELNQHLRTAATESGLQYDWKFVAEKIFDVYEMAMNGLGKVALASDSKLLGKFFNK